MERCSIITVAVLGTACGGLSWAQQPANHTLPEAGKVQPAYLLAEFTQSLNGRKLKPGDRVRAEVTQDVLERGKIVIPEDSKLVGHVTEVKPRGKDQASCLGIVFDKILLKHHQERNLLGLVYALSPPTLRRSLADEPDLMLPPSYVMGGALPMSRGSSSASRTSPALSASSDTTLMSRGLAPPLSLGVRPGVYGMKGLSLTLNATGDTPGPVILSTASDVRLDWGTQAIIKVTDGRSLGP